MRENSPKLLTHDIKEPLVPAFPSPKAESWKDTVLRSNLSPARKPLMEPFEKFGGSAPQEPSSPGIFDDADEDETFDIQEYKSPPNPIPKPNIIRPDLFDVILGTPPKSKLPMGIDYKSNDSPDMNNDSEKKLSAKRKKPVKPMKKVFVAKKEQEAAAKAIGDSIDLLRVLPEEDCYFLGEHLWIFTLQQLESAIFNYEVGESTERGNKDEKPQNRNLRQELLDVLASKARVKENNAKMQDKKVVNGNGLVLGVKSESLTAPMSTVLPAESSRLGESASSEDKADEQKKSSTHGNLSDGEVAGDIPPRSVDDGGPSSQGKTSNVSENAHVKREAEIEDLRKVAIQDAELQLENWKAAVELWRRENEDEDLTRDQFPLDGPLSRILPASTSNFCASIEVKNAFDFLSLKRTETGVVVDMLRLWRRKCQMVDMSALPLAKHLLGIGLRLETALGSNPHADADTREWMGGQLVVLTGAAKDFIIDECRIFSARDFIERRTKDLSEWLSDWRVAKSLPPLKGTGKVAMISAWKAIVKEAIDVEAGDGLVIKGVDFLREVENEDFEEKEEKKGRTSEAQVAVKKGKEVKNDPKPSGQQRLVPQIEEALNSPYFLPTLFKEEKVEVMASVGIKTAQQLLDADKKADSPLVQAVIKMRSESMKLAGSVQPSSCVRLIYDWCQRVKQRLDEINSGKPPKARLASKVQRDLRHGTDDAWSVDSSEMNFGSKEIPTKETSSKIETKDKLSSRGVSKWNDPYECLSSSTKTFLGTLNINTAEAFLSTRTTDIANAFITYREQQKMAVLKGLGAVASVSGWKAQVRKAAKVAGLDDIAVLEPGDKARVPAPEPQVKPHAKPFIERKAQPITFQRPYIRDTIEKGLLFGLPRRKFGVRSTGKPVSLPSAFTPEPRLTSLNARRQRRKDISF